jgi:acetyl-CoA carboxylase biotin carboxyl carrier protein
LDQQVRIDSHAVRSLAELLRETDLTEIEYQVDSLRIKVSRTLQQTIFSAPPSIITQPGSATTAMAAEAAAQVSNTGTGIGTGKGDDWHNHSGVIEAQMVGTVYLSPGHNAPQFVSVGDKVSMGQTLFIIEAMKVMNMIKSPRSGTVKHIFVKDSQPVEYGDPVIVID